jgi:glucose/arabinose dehydrogenase
MQGGVATALVDTHFPVQDVSKESLSMNRITLLAASALFAAACSPAPVNAIEKSSDRPFDVSVQADFDEPWAMTFVPGTAYALITEKKGKLLLWQPDGLIAEVGGVPAVDYGGQGGLGDIILAPDYAKTGHVYLSWVEAGENDTRGAVVGMAKLDVKSDKPALSDLKIIWKQNPKVSGRGHYGHRLAFSPDGKYLFIASGERQKFDPAQDMNGNLGKVLRLYPDGSVPKDNPFYDAANPVKSEIWSLGHRNPLGLAFDSKGQLWNQEMGPAHGDELNLVKKGANYGYPKVSNGDHYDGKIIPDHAPGDGFEAPAVYWNPAISPAGLMFYDGKLFPAWKNSMFIGGLSAKSLVRVQLKGSKAEKADEWDMGARIREIEQGPDGAVWILEDGIRGSQGRLLKLTPKK